MFCETLNFNELIGNIAENELIVCCSKAMLQKKGYAMHMPSPNTVAPLKAYISLMSLRITVVLA